MLMLRRLDGLSERLNQWRLEGKGETLKCPEL